MKKNIYRTGGRDSLISFFSQNPDRQFTTEALCLAINGDAERGKSSVYRHLSELCEDDIVRKFRDEEQNCNVYQYVGKSCDCGKHFHEKCLSCGKLRHLECDDSIEFAAHLLKVHGFAVDCGQSILYGLCAECRERKEERA